MGLLLSGWLVLGGFCARASPAARPIGDAAGVVSFVRTADGYGVVLTASPEWYQQQPLQIEVVTADGSSHWITKGYDAVEALGHGHATGEVKTPGGARLVVVDQFDRAEESGGFTVNRTVRVLDGGDDEVAFGSRFSLGRTVSARELSVFIPGVWYGNRSHEATPPGALAGDVDAAAILVREDRLPLPMVVAHDPHSVALCLSHERPNGSTFMGDVGTQRIVDSRMQFGSIGVLQGQTPKKERQSTVEIAFQYPGSEGSRTYIGRHRRGNEQSDGWANRSHPLHVDAGPHSYLLRFTVHGAEVNRTTFAQVIQSSWRNAFDHANPQPPQADADKAFQASLDLLDTISQTYHGTPSVPFATSIPNGTVLDTSSQMGFVGKALPSAQLLLRTGIDAGRQALVSKAIALVDVWVTNAMTASGVPKTWFNTCAASQDPAGFDGGRCHPDEEVIGTLQWRRDSPYMGHLRIMSEGCLGVLQSYELLYTLRPQPHWLAFVVAYGEFLLAAQAEDGSIAGEWGWSESRSPTVLGNFTNVSDHPIPFLLALANLTKDGRYHDAAIKAGQFSAELTKGSFLYRGGACDNPDVLDKEAGALALRAFVELHEATGDEQWLASALQAATFVETWTYAWEIPLFQHDPLSVYPPSRTTLGASLIASGQSGADNFAAYCVYDFYKLYRLTGDQHWRDYALFLQDATKQVMDLDGTLGYAHSGLMNEAIGLSMPGRGRGVAKYLPWLGCAVLEPMVRLRDEYGSYDLRKLQ